MGCTEGCVYHERFLAHQHAQRTGAWADGSPFANPTYHDPWEDDFDWSSGENQEAPIRLNPAQQQVADHVDGPLLVVAGAGSGKTRAITMRIGNLVNDHHIPPNEILAVTFTRKAATEMRERVGMALGERAKKITISTFHSLALGICRNEAQRLYRTAGFSVWDDKQMEQEMRRILRAEGEHWSAEKKAGRPGCDLPTASSVLGAIGNRKLAHGDLFGREWLSNMEGEVYQRFGAVTREYEELKRAANAFDYDDLIYQACRLLDDPHIRTEYHARWHYVMVDEYQDTNDLQERFLRGLVGEHNNLVAVGDEDQAIYGWRGANVEHILTFTDRYPTAQIVELGQNYRSTPQIVQAAAYVVANNKIRRPKKLWTDNETGWEIEYPICENQALEATHIARSILASIEAGYTPSEHAVLVRTRRQLISVQQALTDHKVEHQTVGYIDLWQRSDIKLILSWLKVALNPKDITAGALAFSHWPRIGAKTVATWRDKSVDWKGVFDAMHLLHAEPGCSQKTKKGIEIARFQHTWRSFIERVRRHASIQELVLWLYEHTGLDQSIKEGSEKTGRIAEEAESRRQLRDVFVSGCPDEPAGPRGIQSWLDAVMMHAKRDPEIEQVTLTTIHSAKGLEWDHVWVAGCVEGLLPHGSLTGGQAKLDAAQVEEERRLAYVAFTRARKRLVLSRSKEILDYSSGRPDRKFVKPSRFLIESTGVVPVDPPDRPKKKLVLRPRSHSG
jgi:DNA helicase-2/ATP-dependent DNA helicase PcrA